MAFTRETIKIRSLEAGVDLDVWLYKPTSTPAPYPVVVAGNGLCLTKSAGLAPFGEHFASDAGYATLILDYRGFGGSGGKLRNLVSVKNQTEDFESVIAWARARPKTFRPDKVVLMGSFFAGLPVGKVMLKDAGLAGGIAQGPMLDAYASVRAAPLDLRLVSRAMLDYVKGKLGFPPTYIPVLGQPGEMGILIQPGVVEDFRAAWEQGDVPWSKFDNAIPARLAIELMSARPGASFRKAKSTLLVILCEDDNVGPIKVNQELAEKSEGKMKVVWLPGGHFDVLKGGKAFDANITKQVEYLKSLL